MNRQVTFMLAVSAMLVSTAEAQAPEFKHLHGGRVGNVFFLNETRGYSAEDGARIRITDDGGQTWEHQKTPDNVREELGDVFFVDNLVGWAATTKGAVLGTTNGGNTWTQINTSPPVILNAFDEPAKINTIFMFDAQTGWLGATQLFFCNSLIAVGQPLSMLR